MGKGKGNRGGYYNNFRSQLKKKDRQDIMGRIEWIVPRVYASIACELWDMGWNEDQIQDMFRKSQERWRDSEVNKWDMLKNVEDVIGIPLSYFRKTGSIVDGGDFE